MPEPLATTDLLDPKNDYVFFRVFSEEPELLVDLINAVRRDEPPIVEVRLLNPRLTPERLSGKSLILDLRAIDERGQRCTIEMQVHRFAHLSGRGILYLARLLSEQLDAGVAYRLGQLPERLSAWIAYFEHWQEESTMSTHPYPPVQRAIEKLRTLSADEEARYWAEARAKALSDEASLLDDAREEGREEGLEQGRRETARAMLARTQLDDATVAEIAGLALAEVQALRTTLVDSSQQHDD